MTSYQLKSHQQTNTKYMNTFCIIKMASQEMEWDSTRETMVRSTAYWQGILPSFFGSRREAELVMVVQY